MALESVGLLVLWSDEMRSHHAGQPHILYPLQSPPSRRAPSSPHSFSSLASSYPLLFICGGNCGGGLNPRAGGFRRYISAAREGRPSLVERARQQAPARQLAGQQPIMAPKAGRGKGRGGGGRGGDRRKKEEKGTGVVLRTTYTTYYLLSLHLLSRCMHARTYVHGEERTLVVLDTMDGRTRQTLCCRSQ